MAYVGVVHEGMAMFFNAAPGKTFADTVCAAVMWSGDKRIVQRGQSYRKGEVTKTVLKARADRMADKWNRYYKRTGKRYELELDKKRQAKEAKAKVERERVTRLRAAAPELLDMLKALTKEVRFATGLEPLRKLADEMTARLGEII